MKRTQNITILSFLALLFAAALPTYAQQWGTVTAGSRNTGFLGGGYEGRLGGTTTEEVDNQFHMYSDSRKVEIFLGDNSRFINEGNFDMVTSRVKEFTSNGKVYYFTPDMLDGFTVYDKSGFTQRYVRVEENKYNTARFMEVLNEGDAKVYLHSFMVKAKPGANGAYNPQGQLEDFTIKEEYFYQLSPDAPLVEFYPSRSTLKKVFGRDNEEIKEYMRSNFLNYGKIENFAKVFDYYNSL